MSKQSLESAVNIATSQAKLAEALGVTQQTVSNWMRRGSVPPEHCSAIERLTGGAITRRNLRPYDWMLIWPELAEQEQLALREAA